MSLGLVGKKIGMTRVFTEQGKSQPVTVVEILPNKVTQIKTEATDGYNGLQLTTGERRSKRVSKAMKGHFAKAGVEPGRGVWEFHLEAPAETQAGSELTVGLFTEGQKVDVTGQSIGKGFAGVMKRHGFRGGRASHGNSKAHRLAGSTGNAQDPGRVFKGKKMAGHMGAEQVAQQNLVVVRVDSERNLILISGSIPGAKGADVIIRPSVKSDGVLTIPDAMPDNVAMTKDNQQSNADEQVENQSETQTASNTETHVPSDADAQTPSDTEANQEKK